MRMMIDVDSDGNLGISHYFFELQHPKYLHDFDSIKKIIKTRGGLQWRFLHCSFEDVFNTPSV